MTALTQEQVDSYRYNGFLSPFPVLSPEETAACLAGLQRFETFIGSTRAEGRHALALPHPRLPALLCRPGAQPEDPRRGRET